MKSLLHHSQPTAVRFCGSGRQQLWRRGRHITTSQPATCTAAAAVAVAVAVAVVAVAGVAVVGAVATVADVIAGVVVEAEGIVLKGYAVTA